jgi:hypothetical protein
MPSIELICINQKEPVTFPDAPFSIIGEDRLVSHRVPSPLFQSDFNALSGCIYHLGDPDLHDRPKQGVFTAYDLLSEQCRSQDETVFLEFNEEYVPFMKNLIQRLLHESPIGKVLFTSDYQFGPRDAQRYGVILSEGFWALHNTRKLRFNTSYEISKNPKKRKSKSKGKGTK